MARIAKSLTDLIGHTPLLELSNYNKVDRLQASLIAKIESFNPLSSVKDRIAFAIIRDAEEKGLDIDLIAELTGLSKAEIRVNVN